MIPINYFEFRCAYSSFREQSFHKTTRKYKQHCQKCVNDINCELLDTSYQCFWHCLDNEIILNLGKSLARFCMDHVQMFNIFFALLYEMHVTTFGRIPWQYGEIKTNEYDQIKSQP